MSDERKKIIEQQYTDLKLTAPLYFLPNPASISNSTDYLPSDIDQKDQTTLKVLCCARSHIRALEFASREESPEFTIILEDDVAMHKSQFTNGIEEIITNWNTLIYPNKMASIGWIPFRNYEEYIAIESTRKLKCVYGMDPK